MTARLLLGAGVWLGAPGPAAAQTPTITLSVPAGTSLAEDGRIQNVVVTATAASPVAAETTIVLSLGGTADMGSGRDYVVPANGKPDITIAAGQTIGTSQLALRPQDDAYYEGDETIAVGGAASGFTVTTVDIPVLDGETQPNLVLRSLGHPIVFEGTDRSHLWVVSLAGGGVFEEDVQFTVSIDAARSTAPTSLHTLTNLPQDITLEKGARSTRTEETSIEFEEDTDIAGGNILLVARATYRQVSYASEARLTLVDNDGRPQLRMEYEFLDPSDSNKSVGTWLYPGKAYTLTVTLSIAQADNRALAVPSTDTRITVKPPAALAWWSPMEFTFRQGEAAVRQTKTATTTIPTAPQWTGVIPITVDHPAEIDRTFGPAFVVSDVSASLEIGWISQDRDRVLTRQRSLQFPIKFSRPLTFNSARLALDLDSGRVFADCVGYSSQASCAYTIQAGDWDWDGIVFLPEGGFSVTGLRDAQTMALVDTSTVLPFPDADTVGYLPAGYSLGRIYGGTHAVNLSLNPESLQEGSGTSDLTITAIRADQSAGPLSLPLEVPLRFVHKDTSDGDFTAAGTMSLTIPSGRPEGRTTIRFTPTDDFLNEEAEETVEVDVDHDALVARGRAGEVFARRAQFTIHDGPSFRLTPGTTELTEQGGAQALVLTAELADAADSPLPAPITITLDLSGGSAVETEDFTWSGGPTVTIPASNRSATVTLTITPTDDKLLEGDEKIRVRGTGQGRPVRGTELTIQDDETLPAVTLETSVTEVAEEGEAVTVTVSAGFDPDVAMATGVTTVTLDLGGTAVRDTDYTATWGSDPPTITIQPLAVAGQNTVTLTLTPTDDSVQEGDETVVIEGSATPQDLVVKVAPIAILDDDESGLRLSETALTVAEGAQGSYTVSLASEPTSEVQVSVSSADQERLGVSPDTLTFPVASWETAQTVTVEGVDDDYDREEAVIAIRHTATGGGYGDLVPRTLQVTVTDNDAPTEFSVADAKATEGSAVEFTVTRSGASGGDATVKWRTLDDATEGANAATAGADYTAVTTRETLTFADGVTEVTFTVTTTADGLHEGDETFRVELSEPGEGAAVPAAGATATGTITDDDAIPSFSITDAEGGEDEDLTFTVTRAGATANVVSVEWTTAPDDAQGAVAATRSPSPTTTPRRPGSP